LNNKEPGKVFLVVALTLAAGVPLALFTVYYFAASTKYLTAFLLILLIVVSIIGVVLAVYWRKIAEYVLNKPVVTVSTALHPLMNAVEFVGQNKYDDAKQELKTFSESASGIYSWILTRQWILSGSIGLLLGFSALVGSALLKQQNDLITEQNQFFRQQIDQQQTQIKAQQDLANQTIRNEAINRIYGAAHANSPRVRAEAVRSLVAVERVLIESGINTLPTDFINLTGANLTDAWLTNADLRKLFFRKADMKRANLSSADTEGSVFRYSDLKGADFLYTKAKDTIFAFVHAQNSSFRDADLTKANLNQSDFSGSDFSGADFSEATLYKAKLTGADLSGIQNWRTIQSMEGTSIYKLKSAPEGFKEWALEQGALDNADALSDIDQIIERNLVEEEGEE